MNTCQFRIEDIFFVVSRELNGPAQLQALPAFAEVDGASLKKCCVTMPRGVRDAATYRVADDDLRACAWASSRSNTMR
ncbi:MAG: hypothetical protein ABJA49_15495 [Betaproteobacteria bacterium]